MDSPSINPDGQELYDQLTNACGADWQQAARRVHKETSIVEPRDKKTRSCVLRGVICRNKWYLKNHQWFLKGETGTELSSGEHSHDAMYTTQHGDGEIPCWMEEITWVYIEILCMYTCTYSIFYGTNCNRGVADVVSVFSTKGISSRMEKRTYACNSARNQKLGMISLDISQLHSAGFQSPNWISSSSLGCLANKACSDQPGPVSRLATSWCRRCAGGPGMGASRSCWCVNASREVR